jgi:hypothetical protein
MIITVDISDFYAKNIKDIPKNGSQTVPIRAKRIFRIRNGRDVGIAAVTMAVAGPKY